MPAISSRIPCPARSLLRLTSCLAGTGDTFTAWMPSIRTRMVLKLSLSKSASAQTKMILRYGAHDDDSSPAYFPDPDVN